MLIHFFHVLWRYAACTEFTEVSSPAEKSSSRLFFSVLPTAVQGGRKQTFHFLFLPFGLHSRCTQASQRNVSKIHGSKRMPCSKFRNTGASHPYLHHPEVATFNIFMYFTARVFIPVCTFIHMLGAVLGTEWEPSFN